MKTYEDDLATFVSAFEKTHGIHPAYYRYTCSDGVRITGVDKARCYLDKIINPMPQYIPENETMEEMHARFDGNQKEVNRVTEMVVDYFRKTGHSPNTTKSMMGMDVTIVMAKGLHLAHEKNYDHGPHADTNGPSHGD